MNYAMKGPGGDQGSPHKIKERKIIHERRHGTERRSAPRARNENRRITSRRATPQPPRQPALHKGAALTRKTTGKLAARVLGRASLPIAAVVGAYNIGKAAKEGYKAYKAHQHASKTEAHAQKFISGTRAKIAAINAGKKIKRSLGNGS